MSNFTRKFLGALGIEPDKIDEIMKAHVEVTDGLKDELSKARDSEEELSKTKTLLQKAEDDLKAANEKLEAVEKDDYKGKYESKTAELEELKNSIASKEKQAKRESALRAELKAEKFSNDAIDTIFDSRRNYADKVEIGEDGKATNMKAVIEEIKTNHAKLIPQEIVNKHQPQNPPNDSGTKPMKTRDEIMAIKDTAERQKAIMENPEAFKGVVVK